MKNISSWDEFVVELKSYFLPYEFTLDEKIRKRNQSPLEKGIVFIASMQNLFNRLTSKPNEETHVGIYSPIFKMP